MKNMALMKKERKKKEEWAFFCTCMRVSMRVGWLAGWLVWWLVVRGTKKRRKMLLEYSPSVFLVCLVFLLYFLSFSLTGLCCSHTHIHSRLIPIGFKEAFFSECAQPKKGNEIPLFSQMTFFFLFSSLIGFHLQAWLFAEVGGLIWCTGRLR